MRLHPSIRLWALPITVSVLLAACGDSTPSTGTGPGPGGTPAPVDQPALSVENLDSFPAPDRMVFSRIQENPNNQYGVHDQGTLKINNTGQGTLNVTSAVLSSSDWVFNPALKVPFMVAPGASVNIGVRFVGSQANTLPPRLYSGILTLNSDDPSTPAKKIALAGLWQPYSETYPSTAYSEPKLDLIRQTLGLEFALTTPADAANPGQSYAGGDQEPINQHGAVKPQGDEVIAPYWVAADASKPVTVLQVGAWSQQINTSKLYWYPKGAPSGTNDKSSLIAVTGHKDHVTQTLFPSAPGANGQQVPIGFTPGGAFGLNVDTYAWSDPTLNDQNPDRNHGCVNLCGQYLRAWPLKYGGVTVPNAYIVGVDFGGFNDDYNDELYLLRNVKPAPILLKVGSTDQKFTGSDGRVWLPDRLNNSDVYFTPANAVDEPASAYTGTVSGTPDPGLYATYRGNVGSSVPQNQRKMTFTVPVNNGIYTVKLHFAELFHTAAGQRVFNVTANNVSIPNLDIFAQAGGAGKALVKTLDGVQVTGGKLVVTLDASVDYPALSAIELVR